MTFPYAVSRKFDIEIPNDAHFDLKQLLREIIAILHQKEAANIKNENNTISFAWRNSFFYFLYPASLSFHYNNNKLRVSCSFELMELVKILLVVIVFIAFFARMQIIELLIFEGFVVGILYLFNVLYINRQLRLLVVQSPMMAKIEEINYIKRQQKLFTQPRCKNCGKPLNLQTCLWCGTLHKNKKIPDTTNISKYYNVSISYLVRKKQNKK